MFESLIAEGKKALIPYFMGGWPDPETFRALLMSARDSGADAVEVGIPFSDPLADGPVIERAGREALRRAVTPLDVLDMIRDLDGCLDIPVILMSYVNPILRCGLKAYFASAARAGISGLILPDLPPEEESLVKGPAAAEKLLRIPMISPNASAERVVLVARKAEGFIYMVSVIGVTGERPYAHFDLGAVVNKVRGAANLPVCIGFGISTPAQAHYAGTLSDGIIVGSSIVNRILRGGDRVVESVRSYLAGLRGALGSCAMSCR
jgi:tryptophan synthase alpha chain